MRKVSQHLWPLLTRPGTTRDQKNIEQIFFQQFGSGLITYLYPTWKAEGATSGAALCKENQKKVCHPRKQTQAETREGEEGRKYGSCCGPGAFRPLVLREGNGNPLQYSCLENPMDGGAW